MFKLDSDQQFLCAMAIILGTFIWSIVHEATGYWEDHNTKIVEMIDKGVDPIAALCAMQDDMGNNPSCVILATKVSKDE